MSHQFKFYNCKRNLDVILSRPDWKELAWGDLYTRMQEEKQMRRTVCFEFPLYLFGLEELHEGKGLSQVQVKVDVETKQVVEINIVHLTPRGDYIPRADVARNVY